MSSQWYGPDLTMCAICFGPFKIEELYVDEQGDTWDVCHPCGQKEAYVSELIAQGVPRSDVPRMAYERFPF